MHDRIFYDVLNEIQKMFYDLYKSNGEYEGGSTFTHELNAHLRNRKIDSNWESIVNIIDSILDLHISEKPMTLYRATYLNHIEKQIKNGTIIDPGFLSTTWNKNKLKTHYRESNLSTPVLLIIQCPAETKMAPMDTNPSNGTSEDEMILERNLKLKIVNNYESTDPRLIETIFYPMPKRNKVLIFETSL